MKDIKDPSKLKVVELRAELSARGLDTKGNKPVLVSRLREALEAETGVDLPNTSIADTSTEDFDTTNANDSLDESANERMADSPEASVPETDQQNEDHDNVNEDIVESKPQYLKRDEHKEGADESVDFKNEENSSEESSDAIKKEPENSYQEDESHKRKYDESVSEEIANNIKHEDAEEMAVEEDADVKDESSLEPRSKKSRWGAVSEDKPPEPEESVPPDQQSDKSENQEAENRSESREKRRRSPSPRMRSRTPPKPDDEPEYNTESVLLSWSDSDLQLEISKTDFCSARPVPDIDHSLWAGARATYGVSQHKVFYEVKLLANTKQPEALRDEPDPFVVRVGWSVQNSSLQLGEDVDSFGFDGTGKKVSNKKFVTYGKSFNEGDVIGTYLDLESDPISIAFTVNGENQGVAFQIAKEDLGERALFPHILTKNVSYEVNFGQKSEGKWFEPHDKDIEQRIDYVDDDEEEEVVETKKDEAPKEKDAAITEKNGHEENKTESSEEKPADENGEEKEEVENGEPKEENVPEIVEPEEKPPKEKILSVYAWTPLTDYRFIEELDNDDKVQGPVRLAKREDCEVIMMCGLPYSGKTHWVNEWVKNNPEKNYTVLGPSQVLQKMTVRGKPRKTNRRQFLIDNCARIVNKLIEIASLRRRNYILDQTHILPSGQRRKMRSFEGFQRRAVVIVPSEEEYVKRQTKRTETDGKDVADSAVLEMKANMSLPEQGDPFIEVQYPELNETEAKALIEKYNEEGRQAGYGPQYSNKRPRHDWNDRRNNSRHGGQRNDRRNNRWGDHGPRSGGHNDRRHGNWGGGSRHGGGWGGPGGRHGPPPPPMRGAGYGHSGGAPWKNAGNNRSGGGSGYNRNHSGGSRGYDRNRSSGGSQSSNRNQSRNSNWGSSNNWNQNNWSGGQNQWGSGGGSGGSQGGNWSNYGSSGQWKGYNQGTPQSSGNSNSSGSQAQNASSQSNTPSQQWVNYPNYAQWGNYYQPYAQGWGTQGQGANSTATQQQMYNQYSQWAQMAQQAGYGGYATTAANSQSSSSKKDDKKA